MISLVKQPLLLIFIILCSCLSNAAPLPATSSSMIVSQYRGLYLSNLGFKIHAGNTLWKHEGSPIENPSILTMYKGPQLKQGIQPALTVRLDKLKKNKNLSRYIKAWKKDYIRFGFKILSSKKVKINSNVAYLLDLANSGTDKQLRQLIYLKSKKAVILTCRGAKADFSSTIKSCNNIFRNFSWL